MSLHETSYTALREEGIDLVKRLAGEIWTDFGEHDPGVTILEQLAYALTDLCYRAELPMADLLVDPTTGRIDSQRQAMFGALQIFPCNPLTQNDFRKILVDRMAAVANAWLTPVEGGVRGRYKIHLYVPTFPELDAESRDELLEQVRRCFVRHRGVCEDIAADGIVILRPVPTEVGATVEIGSAPDAAEVLADVLFRVGALLAPEIEREPLGEGVRPGEIFDGPLLDNGLITDDQLCPKAQTMGVSDVATTIAGSAGVRELAGVSIRRTDAPEGEGIDICASEILRLDPASPIRLFRDGIEVRPDRLRVEAILARKWAQHRQVFPLAAQLAQEFRIPGGRPRELDAYFSIQNQFSQHLRHRRIWSGRRERPRGQAIEGVPTAVRATAGEFLLPASARERPVFDRSGIGRNLFLPVARRLGPAGRTAAA